ncbi:DUF2059 domain-containing protein [Undibacterium sp. TJN19]|uniref:DUF2059 domain-containing protein n=1 Tax=Undibacterium sp. TJN19 TaxID=3413055 RepID=UPI003BF10E66
MKLWSKLLIAAMLVCGSAHAEKPSEASLKEMLTLTNTQQVLKSVEAQMDGLMKNMMQKAMKDQPLNEQQQKIMDKFRNKVIAIHKQEMTWEKLEPTFIEIYGNSLSQEDVDGIIAFYKSPAGKSYVSKMPVLIQQSMSSMQKMTAPMMEKIAEAAKEMTAEMQNSTQKK